MKKAYYTVDLGMNSRYKTLFVCIFLSLFSFPSGAQEVITIGKGSSAIEMLILPLSFPTDSPSKYGFRDMGSVRTRKLPKKNADFRAQLEKVAEEVAKNGGNVLQLTRIEDHNQGNRFKFWGNGFKSEKIGEIKAKEEKSKKEKFSDGSCYFTLYRPAYNNAGFNDSVTFDITINDTLKLEMKSNTKYILKIAKAGTVKLDIKHKSFLQHMNVDVKPGNNYYVRNYVNFPGMHKYINAGDVSVRLRGYTPYLEQINDKLQGEIESSMVTQITFQKKI